MRGGNAATGGEVGSGAAIFAGAGASVSPLAYGGAGWGGIIRGYRGGEVKPELTELGALSSWGAVSTAEEFGEFFAVFFETGGSFLALQPTNSSAKEIAAKRE